MLTPSQIKDKAITIGENKANLSCINQFLLGILAGAFIAFGSQASSMATHTIEAANTAKFIGGLIFPAGLIMVLVAGAELFTGNCLMIISFAEKRITLAKLFDVQVTMLDVNERALGLAKRNAEKNRTKIRNCFEIFQFRIQTNAKRFLLNQLRK